MSSKTIKKPASMEDYEHQSGAFVRSNVDLLTEILIRLPATSILRFKSVSKHWRSLLSHRNFTLRYDRLSKSPGLFIGYEYIPFNVENRSTLPSRSLNFYFDLLRIKIKQSCNGLLLCCNVNARENVLGYYYILNPTTKQVKGIPSVFESWKARKTICFMGLAFHQTDCVHFKLICVLKIDRDAELFQIQTFSSKLRTWKICIESFPAHDHAFEKGVYWNGAVYWNGVYFKMDTEELLMLPMPMMSSEIVSMYIGESRGHLHLIVKNYHDYNKLKVNVYEMLSDHSGWFVKYQVELDHLPSVFPEMVDPDGFIFEIIDLVRGEKEEDTFMVLYIPRMLIAYNVHRNSFKQIFNLSNNIDYRNSNIHRYIETLGYF